MNPKRITTLLLAFLTMLAASCGSVGQSETTTATDSETTEAMTETSEYKKPDVDYGGAKFTVMEEVSTASTWKASSYFDIRAFEENGDPLNDAQYKRNRAVEEALGVKFEYADNNVRGKTDDASEFVRTQIMAADDFADIVFLNGKSFKSLLAEDGMLLNFRDFRTLNINASWWDANAVDTFTFNNTTKVLTGDISLYSSFAPMLLFLNKNVADIYKLENCYDLVRSGKWTYDRMKEMCVAVAGDLNGDSIMDENDRFGMAEQAGLIGDMLIACGVKFTERDASGKLTLALNTEKTASLVAEFVTFLNDDQVNNRAGAYSKKYKNVFYDLHIPMFRNDQLLFDYQQLLIAFELRAMEADYGLIPFPKYDEEQENYLTATSNHWITFVCVPATVSDTDRVGHVLDALGYYSQQLVTPEFIDTTVRAKSLRDEDSAEMLGIILDNIVYDIAAVYNWGNLRTMVDSMCAKKDTNFASNWAASEAKIKSEMDSTLNMLD